MTKRRVVLATFGSLGDLHPYLAIGQQLMELGIEAVVATSHVHEASVLAAGLEFAAMRPDLPSPEANPDLMSKAMDLRTGSVYVVRSLVMPYVREMYFDLVNICKGADALVAHALIFPAFLAAQTTNVRWISTVLQPLVFLSISDPSLIPGFPDIRALVRRLPVAGRIALRLVRAATARWYAPVDALSRELRSNAVGFHPFDTSRTADMTLALFSKVLQAPQSDWPLQTVQCGFPFYEQPDVSHDVTQRIEAFLSGGDPPIVFTLGSAAVHIPGQFYAESAQAASLVGRRAILLAGNDAAPASTRDVLVVPYAPFSTLFPRAAAVVHQGGIGTTAEVLRARVPMVVVPFGHDQPDNASRVARLGVSTTVARSHYTARSAAAALNQVLGDPAYRLRADDMGTAIAGENGARAAALAIQAQCNLSSTRSLQ